MSPVSLPDRSIIEYPPVDQLECSASRFALAYWRKQRGSRLFPSRKDMELRALAGFVHHMGLLKVIDGGADFEHRFVGDVNVMAHKTRLQNRKYSEIAIEAPHLASVIVPLLKQVVETRAPLGMKSRSGPESVMASFTGGENLFLPLGDTDEEVDHIAIFSTYTYA